jgi:hypothetical protein
MDRGGYNLLSMVTAEGDMRYSITEEHIQSERYRPHYEKLIKW